MVLAWMGGVIAVLGLTFLFVLAARRGWFIPPLRLAVGLAVSGGLLGFAVWFHHRRAGRYHAVLAAAGAGIAGLYATLFAAAEMYHYLNRPAALACAGAIAVLSTLVALDVDAEPLAVFGVPAAILAPLLVAREVTPLGLAFGALIGVAALVCMQRRRWVWLTVGVLVVGLPQVLWLAATTDSGFGLWMLGPLLFAALWAATMFLYALRRAAPRHLDQLTMALASAAFAALVATALRAGHGGQVLGTGTDGWLVLAAAVLLMAGAFLPWRFDRAHPDLADLLGAYSLTALALAIGLLLDGSGRACGWAAEAGALAVVGLRVRGRGAVEPGVLRRADRLHAGATVYLVPALVEMVALARPQQALTIAEWGSHRGLVGLAGVALGAAVWAGVAMRTSNWPAWRLWAGALPVAVLAYAAPFAFAGQWVVVAWSGLAALAGVVLAAPRTRRVVGRDPLFAYAGALLLLGAGPTLHAFARLDDALEIDRWGGHTGLIALAGLLAASAVAAAGCLRVPVAWRGWATSAPLAVAAYAAMFVVGGEWVVVGWAALAVALAAVLAAGPARRLLGELEVYTPGAVLVGLAAGVTAHRFAPVDELAPVADWGSRHGPVPLAAVLVGALALTAAAFLTSMPPLRWTTAAPVAGLVYAVPFVLSGDAVLIAWSAIAALVAAPLYIERTRRLLGEPQLFVEASATLALAAAVAAIHDRLLVQLVDPGGRHGIAVSLCLTAAAAVIAFAVRDLRARTLAVRVPLVLACVALATVLPSAWAVAGWALLAALLALAVDRAPAWVARVLDVRLALESAAWLTAVAAVVSVAVYT